MPAEDGIRGYKVSGVQTWALPICVTVRELEGRDVGGREGEIGGVAGQVAGRDVERIRGARPGEQPHAGVGPDRKSVVEGERTSAAGGGDGAATAPERARRPHRPTT